MSEEKVDDTEDEILQRVLALSLQEAHNNSQQSQHSNRNHQQSQNNNSSGNSSNKNNVNEASSRMDRKSDNKSGRPKSDREKMMSLSVGELRKRLTKLDTDPSVNQPRSYTLGRYTGAHVDPSSLAFPSLRMWLVVSRKQS